MEAQDASAGGSNAQTKLSDQDIDQLYDQYQKSQSKSSEKTDELYRQYTKHQSETAGRLLQADPDNEQKYQDYRNAVKSYYEAHGPQGWKEMLPDLDTGKNIIGGAVDFAKGMWKQGKTALQKGTEDVSGALSAAGGVAGGTVAAGVDTLAMPFTAASWIKEKNLAGDGKFDEAADVAAQRLRDISSVRHKAEQFLKPSGEAGAAAYEATKPVAGVLMPMAAGKVLGAMGKGAQVAEAASAPVEAAAAAPGVLSSVGKGVGGVVGGVKGGVTAGIPGAVLGAQKGAEIGTKIGEGVQSALGAVGEGAAIGAVTTGIEEPVGTPLSRGVGPGAAIAGGAKLAGAGVGKLAESYREGRGEVAAPRVRQPGETSSQAELFQDFADDGGKVSRRENRVAVETEDPSSVDTGRGVGRQSQKFKRDDGVGFHEALVKSHEKTQGNETHSTKDDVIRYGYDPEAQTLQVVMAKPTKGDAVPVDRYVYRKVTPEMFDSFSKSESKSDFMNSVADNNTGGVTMTRVRLSDRQLNSIVDALNAGKLDFHKEWGFDKGSGEPRETPFTKPTQPTAPAGEAGAAEMTPGEKESWLTQKAADILDSAFERAAQGAGEAMKATGKAAGKFYGAAKKTVLGSMEEPPSPTLKQPLTESVLQSMRESKAARNAPEAQGEQAALPSGEQAALPTGQRKALAAAAPVAEPTRPALAAGPAQQEALPTGERPPLPTGEQPKLMEPEAITSRRKDVEAAIADKERQTIEEERLRQSPAGSQGLKQDLSIQEQGLKPSLRKPVSQKESVESTEQGTQAFNELRSQLIDEFRSDGLPINRDTVDAATELARTAPKYREALRKAIYQEFAPKPGEPKASLKSFEEVNPREYPLSDTLNKQALEAGAKVEKQPEVPFDEAIPVPENTTVADMKRMSSRMRAIDKELMGVQGSAKRIKLLEERLELAAKMGNDEAAKALERWNASAGEPDFNAKVREIVNKYGLTNDPAHPMAGEIQDLKQNGVSFGKIKKGGAEPDRIGEYIKEASDELGLTMPEDPGYSERDVFEVIKDAFSPEGKQVKTPPVVGEPPIEPAPKAKKQPTEPGEELPPEEGPAAPAETPPPAPKPAPAAKPKKALAAAPEAKEQPKKALAAEPQSKADKVVQEFLDTKKMLQEGKNADGTPLSRDDRVYFVQQQTKRMQILKELNVPLPTGEKTKGSLASFGEKKQEPKVEAPAPKKETPAPEAEKPVAKAKEIPFKISDRLEEMRINDVSKSSIKTYAKKLVKDGHITQKQLDQMDYLFKDKDMGAEDVIGEIESALRNPQTKVSETGAQYWKLSDLDIDSILATKAERGDYPEFTIVSDGETKTFATAKAAEKAMAGTYSKKPRVFRNAGKGITIDFDSKG